MCAYLPLALANIRLVHVRVVVAVSPASSIGPVLLEGFRKLQYSRHDSAGATEFNNNGVQGVPTAGSGRRRPIALEDEVKLEEVSWFRAEVCSTGDLKRAPLAQGERL